MNSERQQAYLNLINQLLNSPSGEEAEILKTDPELLDDGLVAAMLEVADNLREQGKLNNANWLMNCAGMLLGRNNNSSVAVTRKAEADRLLEQGNQQHRISQFREALQSWEDALTIYQEIGNCQGEATSLGNLGVAYNSLGQYKRAIDFHKQHLEISREIGDRQGEANSLGNLGVAYYHLGQYKRAIEFYEQNLKISLEMGDRQGEANSLGNLGNTYNSLGQYKRAIEFHEQSLVISRQIRNRQEEATSLNNLGIAYNSLGDFQRAIEFHEQSLVISRQIRNRQGEAMSLGNLGIAYKSLGQYKRAIEFYEQSLVMKRKIGDRQGEAISLGNLGIACQVLGDLNRAIDFHQQSLVISRQIGNREGEADLLNNLGAIFFINNQLAEAEAALRESIQILENIRSELVNNNHKISILEIQSTTYRLLQKVLVAQSKFDAALEISEMSRTRAFVELLQKTLLTTLPLKPPLSKGGLGGLSIPKIQQIARSRNSTIVEYSIIDPEIYIWVIQPNGNITHRAANLDPLNQQNQTLKQIILKTRVSIGTVETDDADNKIQLESQYKRDETGRFPLLQLLHQILIEPIIDLLPTDVNSPIIFIPHYDLFLVPFSALQDSHNRYLIENHTILTSPSIQVLELTREHQNRVRGLRQATLIVGDPTIHPNFQLDPHNLKQIPRAKEAAEAIAATLGTQAISGDNATKVAILDRMLNTRIVHLSAHGLIDDFQSSGIPGQGKRILTLTQNML
jgi:tetratricopeptide (TPR) repeat protein